MIKQLFLIVLFTSFAHADLFSIANPKIQEDYPAITLDSNSVPWIAYVEFNGESDTLKVARLDRDKLKVVGTLATSDLGIQQPRIARDGAGAIWVVWSQLKESKNWDLYARRIVNGKIDEVGPIISNKQGNDVFPDVATDRRGRLWIAWQAMRSTPGDIYAKHYDPAAEKWSDEFQITNTIEGDWEPRIAFGVKDEAYIAFDTHARDNFDVWMAVVKPDGKTWNQPLASTPAFEARVSIASTPDGKGLWATWERGKHRWGKDWRTHNANVGMNANKQIDVVYIDTDSLEITKAPSPKAVISAMVKKPVKKNPKKKPTPQQAIRNRLRNAVSVTINLPQIAVAADGTPFIFVRYAPAAIWDIAMTRYDRNTKQWSRATKLSKSTFSQERQLSAVPDPHGNIWATWPSDLRTTKKPLSSGVYLTSFDTKAPMEFPANLPAVKEPTFGPRTDPAKDTPERPKADRHYWTHKDTKYGLYWGDFHRHTNLSNCRTITEGSINENFRYAYDAGKLDFLGTSDHTDIAKAYSPYEWWQNQKLADIFQNPGFFQSFYVYEREQKWPWGHRNVVFIERGGPIVYINRKTYQNSPWSKLWPAKQGNAQITPDELWKILKASGKKVTVISHTGATGMGTDWDIYKGIDNSVENLVEIYQSARVSYEGLNTPQPTVGVQKAKPYNYGAQNPAQQKTNFGKYNKGVYQNALKNKHRLGIFTSSDHISTNTSYGGVYAKDFTREAILEGLQSRRTMAATDKIYVEFTLNGELLGSEITTSKKPKIVVNVHGTAPIGRVTIVRNEQNHKVYVPKQTTKDFHIDWTDDKPIAGENRYYIRVEQQDGNMAWASPVWVQFKGK